MLTFNWSCIEYVYTFGEIWHLFSLDLALDLVQRSEPFKGFL